jgi:radical SAM protein with 4Fe4S-binding SPASM domain
MGCFRENQERRAVEYVPYNRYFYNYPILSEIAVTYRCNASCEFCYIDGKDKVEELLTEEMKIILFKIKEEAKVPSVSFTGGEPTLRADLFELIKYARSINLRVNLITNGVNIDERYARLLKDAGLNSVQISLESGDKDEHEYLTKVKGSFNKVLSAIKYIKDNGIFVHTNTTINRLNKQSLAKLVDISKELGTNRLSMNMLMPCGNAANNKDLWVSYTEIGEIVREVGFYAKEKGVEFMWYSPTPFCIFNPVEYGLGNKTCAAAHGLLSVNPLGDILPCSSLNISLGNLLKNNFDEIWFSKKALYYRMLEFAPSSCKSCSLFYVCGAGCPIYFEKVGLSEIMDKSISR